MPKRSKSKAALSRPKPCLGMSPTCPCNMCEERRRRHHEAALAEARAASPYAGLPLLEGLTQAVLPCVQPPPAEATQRLARQEGEATLLDFWAHLHGTHEVEKADMAEARSVARACGFAFSAKLPRYSPRRQLRAQVRCPYLLSAMGEAALTDDSPRRLILKMQAAHGHAVQVEKRALEAVARECGFLLTEAKCTQGLAGSWTALSVEGSVPLHAEHPDELRDLMREAANAPRAPQVEASHQREEEGPAGGDNLHREEPTAEDGAAQLDAADVVDVDELPEGWCEACQKTRAGVGWSDSRQARLCPGCWPVECLAVGVAA
ncbi:hypothetical protein [Archangium sp.]|uniref:hypothetical protein n=1 Tax=Archangium sp. TaxID=1872627 RepID=UPI00286A8246|nr:hypothetical protein [Archangium sp.]